MKIIQKILKFLKAVRNRLVRLEREKIKAYEETNKILAAYIAVLISRHGTVRIPKKAISEALDNYKSSVGVDGEDYVITIEKITPADVLLPDIFGGVEEEEDIGEPSDSEEHSDGELCDENNVISESSGVVTDEESVEG